jgi:hypothetical protein
LARIYGVPTKRLNEQAKRNRKRFPDDFAFQLTGAEFANLKSQFVTSSQEHLDSHADYLNRSQIATGSQKHRDPRFLPYAFTEHGAIMAANVLNSRRAVQMSVFDYSPAMMDIFDPPSVSLPSKPRRIGYRT